MSASTEEYLEALYHLTQDGRSAGTSDISKKLNISPASVTEMLKKLAEENMVSYHPYQGVTLTPAGYKIAEKMTRKHRLLEYFLHNVLNIGNEKVHNEACPLTRLPWRMLCGRPVIGRLASASGTWAARRAFIRTRAASLISLDSWTGGMCIFRPS